MRARLKVVIGAVWICTMLVMYWTVRGKTLDSREETNKELLKMCHRSGKENLVTNKNGDMSAISNFPATIVNGRNINDILLKYFTMTETEEKDTFVNLHSYEYTINSHVCLGVKLFVIIVIHSAPSNRAQRDRIRNTFGSVITYNSLNIGLVFMLGASNLTTIGKEADEHGDIVEGNFQDSYKNLNKKHIMAMHWYHHHCNSDFIVKLDDDTFINPYRIVDFLQRNQFQGNVMYCKIVYCEEPVKDENSKWHTPEYQYPFSWFPPICLGFAYITTPQAWKALYEATEHTRPMDMDDVYVSVALAMTSGVRRVDMDNEMLPCEGPISYMTTEKLNKMTVLLDRFGVCNNYAFSKWEIIRGLNEEK